ncbi:1-deoxy-D-xylulose-5-phosphate reductoisomerase [Candidatus Palauibacter sp.]|uniref:1-deoxy-D-xylulose-5-phosphate reductoisomerase n=1 Tax=Candidatus Palauibacter sp. TaxID=3101350 RepID=UPI003AF27500
MKRVAILGATGSVGEATLRVIRRHTDRFRVGVLTANRRWEALDALALEWDPEFVVLGTEPPDGFAPRWSGEWRTGPGALEGAARTRGVDLVLNALVGFAGLGPTLAALGAGKRLALANKESLVAGGKLVVRALREGGGELLPVDSEHSAVHQCLDGRPVSEVARITLTASGGPFRTWPAPRLAEVRPADALSHPTWSMGSKITIDSATLANKALEVIEAHILFGLPYERIDVVVHPTSIIHSVVEFHDGSSLAQLGRPSMEIPILWALGYPERLEDPRVEPGFDPLRDGPLEFEPVREDVFPLFRAGVAAGKAGGEFPVAFNAANEVAVESFLSGRIGFQELAGVVIRTLEQFSSRPISSVEDARHVDARARSVARKSARGMGSGDAEPRTEESETTE